MMQDLQHSLLSNELTAPGWLKDFQQENRQRWLQQAWPHKKTENWKYTSLKALEQGGYAAAEEGATEGARLPECTALKQQFAIENFSCLDIVFVNGQFSSELSSAEWAAGNLPQGLTVTRFTQADEHQQNTIKQHLGTIADAEHHTFVSLNNGELTEGIFVEVAKNAVVEKPVRVLWLTTRLASPTAMAQRVLLVAGENSQATIFEQFASDNTEQNSFTHGVSEFLLKDNARLFHYRLHQEQEGVSVVSGVHSRLLRNAHLQSFYLAFGSKLKRLDVVVDHQGEGAHCEMNGVYLPRNKQHVDFHTCIEHAVPHCTSNEVFRGIIGDSAKAVFNGRIHIHKNAQKTSAQLSNKNLLTSNKAEVDTKPELEIYADDVQCAHGATVAQLDTTALHYFKTRGVGEDEARVMLSFGFINALVDKVRHQPVAEYLRPILASVFARDPELTRHII